MIWLWLGILAAMFAVFYLIDAAIDALAMWIVSDLSCNHDCNQGRRCRCGGGL